MVDDCINSAAPRELEPDELFLATSEEPTSFAEANPDPAWRAAMEEEMNAIIENGTSEAIDLPAGHRPIGLKWVFKLKKDAQGKVIRHKARLVAKGYVPVARLDSVRALLAVAAHKR
jgi:hypothetical protein